MNGKHINVISIVFVKKNVFYIFPLFKPCVFYLVIKVLLEPCLLILVSFIMYYLILLFETLLLGGQYYTWLFVCIKKNPITQYGVITPMMLVLV